MIGVFDLICILQICVNIHYHFWLIIVMIWLVSMLLKLLKHFILLEPGFSLLFFHRGIPRGWNGDLTYVEHMALYYCTGYSQLLKLVINAFLRVSKYAHRDLLWLFLYVQWARWEEEKNNSLQPTPTARRLVWLLCSLSSLLSHSAY